MLQVALGVLAVAVAVGLGTMIIIKARQARRIVYFHDEPELE